MTIIRLFQPRFIPLIKSGAKLQTIRPWPKRIPVPGDYLEVRQWIGKAYRSGQLIIGTYRIREVLPVSIEPDHISLPAVQGGVSWRLVIKEAMDQEAVKDGFKDWKELIEWFTHYHGKPQFSGVMFRWEFPAIA